MTQQVATLAFVGQSYPHAGTVVSSARSINVWPESNESTRPSAMMSRPGRQRFATIGGTPRAFWKMDDIPYAVIGTTAYKLSASGAATTLGTIAGNVRAGVAHNGSTALVATGGPDYQVTSSTVTEVTDVDAPKGTRVAYHNGYWLKPEAGTNEFKSSAIDNPGSWDALDNAFERQTPGNLVAVMSDHAEILQMKSDAIGFWFESGAASGIPFDRLPQLILHTGITFPDTLIGQLDERVFFVGASPDMPPSVFVLQGRQVRRISNNAIDTALLAATSAYAWRMGVNGHVFYALQIDAATYVYDATTNKWHEWEKSGERYDVTHALRCFGKNLALTEDGHVVEISHELFQDEGDSIVCTRVTAPLEYEGRTFSIDWIEAEIELGRGSGTVGLEISVDRGNHWSNRRTVSLSEGDYTQRIKWDGLGAATEFVPRITHSGNVRFIGASLRAGIRLGRN